MDQDSTTLLDCICVEYGIDPDTHNRIIAIARTIANLDRSERIDDLEVAPLRAHWPHVATAIVPKGSIAGRSLIAVVAIMSFLAGLTAGAVMMVVSAASDWSSDVGREVTIQVRPVAGRDLDADVRKAVEIARATARHCRRACLHQRGIRPAGRAVARLRPHLGELPIPRMIVVKLGPAPRPIWQACATRWPRKVPSASLDDHRGWIDRMRTMAATAVAAGLAILVLVLAVTVLSVTFATRGAMATNRPIVEVLHYVGATDAFVASQFQRHFLLLGFKGGAIGGGGAIFLFGILASRMNTWVAGTPGGDEAMALFGNFSIGLAGYLAILGQIVLMAW